MAQILQGQSRDLWHFEARIGLALGEMYMCSYDQVFVRGADFSVIKPLINPIRYGAWCQNVSLFLQSILKLAC